MRGLITITIIGAATLAAQQGPLQLSLKRAVEMGLSPEGNANLQIAGEEIQQAQSRSIESRADLLPDTKGKFSYQNQTLNLAAAGLQQDLAGINLPRSVGPFGLTGARVYVEQSILDLGAMKRYQASKIEIRSAKSDYLDTQDRIASTIARRYMAALRADASLQAIDENIKLAEAVLNQAEKQAAAGTGTGIEVTRARVVLANEKQRRLVSENDRARARHELLRAMGMRLDTEFELSGALNFTPAEAPSIEAASAQAMQKRSDLKAQLEREQQAQLSTTAAKLDRAPVVKAFGDYGSLGTGFDSSIPTRTAGVSIELPLFDGGRRKAKAAASESSRRQERSRTSDLRDEIELQVRLALDSLRSADREIVVASEGLDLAQKELAQARRRYEAGVATTVEVTDAQSRLAQARDNRVAALYRHNVARIELASATGTVQDFLFHK